MILKSISQTPNPSKHHVLNFQTQTAEGIAVDATIVLETFSQKNTFSNNGGWHFWPVFISKKKSNIQQTMRLQISVISFVLFNSPCNAYPLTYNNWKETTAIPVKTKWNFVRKQQTFWFEIITL